jgi:hypothetical protein
MPNVSTIGKFIVTVLLVMIAIYGIKLAAKKFNIPVISTVAEGV